MSIVIRKPNELLRSLQNEKEWLFSFRLIIFYSRSITNESSHFDICNSNLKAKQHQIKICLDYIIEVFFIDYHLDMICNRCIVF